MQKQVRRFSNFTLIELLVVIAIIAILAGMLLPSLNKARERGKAIKCTSNQKQMFYSISMYTNDYNGFLMYGALTTAASSSREKSLTALWRYIMREKVETQFAYMNNTGTDLIPKLAYFRCPSVTEPSIATSVIRHIGINYFLADSSDSYSRAIRKVRYPAQRLLLADAVGDGSSSPAGRDNTCGYGNRYITFLHNKKAGVVFLDGHANSLSFFDVPYGSWNSRFWGANPNCTNTNP